MIPQPANLDIELVWLDSTLEPATATAPMSQSRSRSSKSIMSLVLVLVLVVLGAWGVHGLTRPTAPELVHAGWQAYQRGDYPAASTALAAALSVAPDAPGAADLQIALSIAPTLDSIEADLKAGHIDKGLTRIQGVLSQAPRDRRAVRLAIRLRTIQADAEAARARGARPTTAVGAPPTAGPQE